MLSLNANPDHLVPCAQKGMGIQGEGEGLMKAMLGVQRELEDAVQSPGGGAAIQAAMYSAWEKGKALSASLQEILQVLMDGAHRIGMTDEDIKGQIMQAAIDHGATSLGTDGVNSVANDMTANGTVNVENIEGIRDGQYTVGRVNTLW